MGKKVLVIGDLIIDTYTRGRAIGLSAESPTLVMEPTDIRCYMGGAGLVVRNLVARGNTVMFIYIDDQSSFCQSVIEGVTVSDRHLTAASASRPIRYSGWTSSHKRRFFVDKHKLLQVDTLNRGRHDHESWNYLVKIIKSYLDVDAYEAMVLCDNGHGTFNRDVAEKLIAEAVARKITTYVDCQCSQNIERRLEWFRGASNFFLNEKELAIFGTDSVSAARELGGTVVLKLGAAGAKSTESGTLVSSVHRGFQVDVVDTCGAGDAFMAGYVTEDGSGAELEFANACGAAACKHIGTVVPLNTEIDDVMYDHTKRG